ncbi:MAG: phosphatidate cytidylyltransferase [Chloroflexi bacterium]|nr:phosphatidate cytidylyltransferase [Chloroflexota bacterium]
MLARLRARGAVRSFRGVRPAGTTVRRSHLSGALTLRVASGIVAVPFLLGVAYVGDPVYGAFICFACAYAAFEVRTLLRSGGYAPLDVALFGTAVFLPLDAWLRPDAGSLGRDGLLLLGLVILVSLATLLLQPTSNRSLVGWALSMGLALYLGGLMQFYFPLRRLPTEVFPGFWVSALLVLSWVCDSSAFFVGRAFGRHRLAPSISPNKSVEGALAGLVGATVVAPLLGFIPPALNLELGVPPLLMAGYGLAIAVATIVGDLVESLLKRQTGAKDSGMLIPGHGGLLDRMDSLLFCAPVAVLYLRAFAA